MLGPMVNPSFPKKQLVGVFSLELARMYGYLYQNNNMRFSIIHALDGYDEISLTGKFKIISNLGERILSPGDISLPVLHPHEIMGGKTIEENAKIFEKVLKGEGSNAQESVVIANAAAALETSYPNWSFDQARDAAVESLKSGQALHVFKKLIDPKTLVPVS